MDHCLYSDSTISPRSLYAIGLITQMGPASLTRSHATHVILRGATLAAGEALALGVMEADSLSTPGCRSRPTPGGRIRPSEGPTLTRVGRG